MLQENLGTKFDVCSVLQPNALLVNVVDVRKLGEGLTKQDYSGRARKQPGGELPLFN
jgi:hypothetical protein